MLNTPQDVDGALEASFDEIRPLREPLAQRPSGILQALRR